jgi:GNAT superfamily N-acetyltransferase
VSVAARPGTVRAGSLEYRPVRPDELRECAAIWRTAINDYTGRLAQPEIPDDLERILRLYTHLRATDPERFVVAVRPDDGRIVGFAAAVVREHAWYLSMLFVLPGHQGAGVGRRLLEAAAPGPDVTVRATATDSAQPISNALYASLGIVPRVPLLRLVGLAERPEHLPRLPDGVTALAFDDVATAEPFAAADPVAAAETLAAEIDALDRLTLGVAHPRDHGWLRAEARRGFLYRSEDGSPIGYGYAGASGLVGPIAVREPSLLAPVLAHLVTTVEPRGAFAVWLPGNAGTAITGLLRSGFQLEGFPVLLCWDEPFADLSRYVPISPGLL